MAFRRVYLHVLGPDQGVWPPYGDVPCRLGLIIINNPNPDATDAESILEIGLQIRPCYLFTLGPGHESYHPCLFTLAFSFLQRRYLWGETTSEGVGMIVIWNTVHTCL